MSEYLTEDKAADHIGFSVSSLRKWRNDGSGPVYIKTGKKGGAVRYTKLDLDKFMESMRVKNTVSGK